MKILCKDHTGKAGIYIITCTRNGKVYIGQSTNVVVRLKDHIRRFKKGNHDNSKMQNAWNKYGASSFISDVIEWCNKDFDVLNEREIYWINKLDALDNFKGFNISSGGGNAYSLAGKTEEEKAEVYSKVSKWRKEYYKTHKSPFYGRHWSEEEKQRIRESVSGSNNIWFGKKRHDHSANMTGSGNPRARAVICVTTDERFGSAKEASEAHGVTNSMILKCCKGVHKTGGKLADGTRLEWKYITIGR